MILHFKKYEGTILLLYRPMSVSCASYLAGLVLSAPIIKTAFVFRVFLIIAKASDD